MCCFVCFLRIITLFILSRLDIASNNRFYNLLMNLFSVALGSLVYTFIQFLFFLIQFFICLTIPKDNDLMKLIVLSEEHNSKT